MPARWGADQLPGIQLKFKKMKKGFLCFMMSALMLTLVSCGNKAGQEDSTEVAEEQNEEVLGNKAEDDA